MNAFLDIADHQLASPVKAKHRAAEKRRVKIYGSDADAPVVPSAQEKQKREQDALARKWAAWHREKEAELLAGPYGKDIRGIVSFIETMTLSSAGALVDMVQQSTWLRKADRDTRHGVLVLVGRGIRQLREKNGLTPFDDSLPGEQPTAYEIIRETLQTANQKTRTTIPTSARDANNNATSSQSEQFQ